MQSAIETAVTAAFLTSGLMEREKGVSRLNPILESWDNGNIELFGYLACDVAPVCAGALDVIYGAASNGLVGVFHYEVTEEVGNAIANYLLQADDWDGDELAATWQSSLLSESLNFIKHSVVKGDQDKAHEAFRSWAIANLKSATYPDPEKIEPAAEMPLDERFKLGSKASLNSGRDQIGVFEILSVGTTKAQTLQEGKVVSESATSIILTGKQQLTAELARKLMKIGLNPDNVLEACACGKCDSNLVLEVGGKELQRMLDCGYISIEA